MEGESHVNTNHCITDKNGVKSMALASNNSEGVRKQNGKPEVGLDRMGSLSLDWTEFERVFSTDLAGKNGEDKLLSMLIEISKMVVKYIHTERDETSKVLDFNHPHQLREVMEHCLNVDDKPRDLEQILSDCKETLKYCVKTAHPRFLNQLSTGLDVIGMTAEWVTAAANTNMFTYEIAPVFTLMEEVVLQRMLSMIGWPEGDAIFAPGGAISNLYALLCARHVSCPQLRETGMSGDVRYTVFTSEHCNESLGPFTLENNEFSGPFTLENNESSGPLTLENKESSGPLTLGNNESSGPLTLENKESSGPLTLENKESSGPLTLENKESSGPLTLENKESSGPLTLENKESSGPLTLENKESSGPLTLENKESSGPLTLENKESSGPLTLENKESSGPLTLENKESSGPLTLGNNESLGPLTLENKESSGPLVLDNKESSGPLTLENNGKMIPADLERCIKVSLSDNKVPLMVNATCGTTVLGAYDPVQEIANICQAYGVWLHVDGAWGGSVLFSKKHGYLLDGVARADSMTWNPHKMMVVPLQCSAVFLKKKGILKAANQMHADYLYQKDKLYDTTYDTGDKAIQCGRHNDVFKLWLMWRSKGDSGFSAQIDRNFDMARYMVQKLKLREDFELVLSEIEGPNVCFWYVPGYIRDIKEQKDKNYQLHRLTSRLKALMMEKGSMLLQYQPLGELPNFFRIAFSNPALTTTDIDAVIQEIVRLGTQIQ